MSVGNITSKERSNSSFKMMAGHITTREKIDKIPGLLILDVEEENIEYTDIDDNSGIIKVIRRR